MGTVELNDLDGSFLVAQVLDDDRCRVLWGNAARRGTVYLNPSLMTWGEASEERGGHSRLVPSDLVPSSPDPAIPFEPDFQTALDGDEEFLRQRHAEREGRKLPEFSFEDQPWTQSNSVPEIRLGQPSSRVHPKGASRSVHRPRPTFPSPSGGARISVSSKEKRMRLDPFAVRDSGFTEELVRSLELTYARLADGDGQEKLPEFTFEVSTLSSEATVMHRGRRLPIDVARICALLSGMGVEPADGDVFRLTPRLARLLIVSSLQAVYRRRDAARKLGVGPERVRAMGDAQRRIVRLIAARYAADALMESQAPERRAA